MRSFLVITLLFLLTAVACTSNNPLQINISEAENGQTIHIKQSDILVLTLDGNPSTGFSWEMDTVDNAVLRPTDEPTFTPESGALGAGGYFVWRFEAVNTGRTALSLVYRRSWETNTSPDRTFEVTVVVS